MVTEYITLRQVAEEYGVNYRTLWNLIQRKRLPEPQRIPGMPLLRFARRELEPVMAEVLQKHTRVPYKQSSPERLIVPMKTAPAG
jgi:predicted DNA-binding transcriptional regulator AlpA